MAGDPYDAFSSVAPNHPEQAAPAPTGGHDDYDAFSSVESPSSPAQPAPTQQPDQQSALDQSVDSLRKLLDDPKVSGQQIRDFYSQRGAKLTEEQSQIIEDRDQFIKANGKAMVIGIDRDHPAEGQPGLTDNRPYSLTQGVLDGVEHVGENIAHGAQWTANHVGADAHFADNFSQYLKQKSGERENQGSWYGKLIGETAATLPTMFLAPEVEGASLLANGGRLAVQGGASGALTTHADTPGGVIRDAAIGAVAAPILGTAARGLRAVASSPSASTVAGREVLDAADSLSRDGLSVRPLPADTGGSTARRITSGVSQGFAGGHVVQPRVQTYIDSVAAAHERAANALAPTGETARPLADVGADLLDDSGLGGFRQRARTSANAEYTAAETASGDPVIRNLPTFGQALSNKINELRSVPNSAANPNLRALEAIQHDVAMNGYTVSGLRRLRTDLGRQLDATNPDSREIARALRQPLSQDIDAGLRAQGHDRAADMYRAADANYAQSRSNLQDIRSVIGPDHARYSPERVAGRLTALAKGTGSGDGELIGRVLTTLQPEQAQHVRASFINNLGRAKPGAQTADGGQFSMETFLTNWQHANFSDSAKASLIPDAGVRADLESIARLAEGGRAANKSRNFSNTAGAANVLRFLQSMGAKGAAIKTAGASLIPEAIAARVATSPTAARIGVRLGEIRPIVRGAAYTTRVAQKSAPAISGYLMNLPKPGETDPTK